MIKFTIAIPAYKSTYFKECIDSILAQTYDNFEIIILNDCSPEPIEYIVKSYTDKRIRYYKNDQNVGAEKVILNWNKCLELAKGKFFLCMGDDDMLAPNCLEEFLKLIDKYPDHNLYHARSLIIDELSKPIEIQEDFPEEETAMAMLWADTIKERNHFVGDYLYRTDRLKEIGGYKYYPLAWGSDFVTTYLAVESGKCINMHTPVFYYRKNTLSITSSGNNRLKMEATQQYCVWLNEYLQKPCELLSDELQRKQLLNNWASIMKKAKIFMIAEDVKEKGLFTYRYWLSQKDRFELTKLDILKSIFISKVVL